MKVTKSIKKHAKSRNTETKNHESLEHQMIKDIQVIPKRKSQTRLVIKELSNPDISCSDDDNLEIIDDMNKVIREAKLQREELEHEESEKLYNNTHSRYIPHSDSEISDLEHDDIDSMKEISESDRQLFIKWTEQPAEGLSLVDEILKGLEPNSSSIEKNNNETKIREIKTNNSLHSHVTDMYKKLGLLLSRYKSGKLPKAFKVLSTLKNWTEVILLTKPDQWTPHSVYQATRLFVSTTKPTASQKFFSGILLPHVRNSIQETGKLNPHLYMALKKAIYKPSAFFKGIIFPLCEHDAKCTLREAAILSSILSKISIPVLHSAAALMKLAVSFTNNDYTKYSGVTSIFIRTLIDKKYTLPYRVIEALIGHFCRFETPSHELPVLWHQSLLSFAQRYKNELTPLQIDQIIALTKTHYHHSITREIIREIDSAVNNNNAPMNQG